MPWLEEKIRLDLDLVQIFIESKAMGSTVLHSPMSKNNLDLARKQFLDKIKCKIEV